MHSGWQLMLVGGYLLLAGGAVGLWPGQIGHPRLGVLRPWHRWVQRQRDILAQAEIGWLSPGGLLTLRLAVDVLAAVSAAVYFETWTLAPITALAVHHLFGLVLERRRRQAQERRQYALLDAMRYGIAVMARSGNASQMVRALAEAGPSRTRELFGSIVSQIEAAGGSATLADALQATAESVADPVFDDFALAVGVSARFGAKLVPALETQLAEWERTMARRREARGLRAGQEYAVRILPLALFGFLAVLQLISPQLTAPLRSGAGEVLLALTAAWMVLGYRLLQRMASEVFTPRIRMARAA